MQRGLIWRFLICSFGMDFELKQGTEERIVSFLETMNN